MNNALDYPLDVRQSTSGVRNIMSRLREKIEPDPRHPRQVVAPRLHEAVHAAARRQQLVGDDERAALMTAAAEHQGDQLVVAEGPGAVHQQFLAWPVVRRELG